MPRRLDGMSKPVRGRRGRALAIWMTTGLVVGATAAHASAATPTFHAFGSAKQVYVTDVAPFAQMSLITPAGKTLYTDTANSLGGLLFRNVPPGTGYRVRQSSDGAE